MRLPEFYLRKPVLSLQTMIRRISEVDSRILPLIPNGIYGANTHASVRSFQEVYGLPVTGSTDLHTWKKIAEVYRQSIAPTAYSASFITLSDEDQIRIIQTTLAALSLRYSDLTAPVVSGVADPTTVSGLIRVQTAASLPQTGTIDQKTLAALNALFYTPDVP